ncbi:TPA: hypothetical protein JEL63_003375 [Salmonella enterica subsp. enterica serovar Enteritidis]|uniref:hypothetical protein n=1 Tax=Salmonella enterica TaxID=28901 RepID=UPI0002A6ED84|nr:hypothetical protein [Salmonella enterica]ELO78599.1 hypothetical protein SEEERB17_010092 [Salmonella enterica subsp. enterica serovar Enteritidis str. SARB17]HAE4696928.1 hypothetical protein [Salmonella enterica subsp. enterica serovar Enteritidis]HAU6873948.1 hypothetical protein [Salmonella enterica subsp. enterica serovar Enteritidis]
MTTNNHPAHGPVSLDRLHQISEILSKASAQSDGGNLGYAMADAVKMIDEVLERRKADTDRLQESAYKAGLTAGWNFGIEHNSTGFSKCLAAHEYTAPPAPVVPDAIKPDYEVIKAILPTANPDEYACCVAADMWNACRAAMLQGGKS